MRQENRQGPLQVGPCLHKSLGCDPQAGEGQGQSSGWRVSHSCSLVQSVCLEPVTRLTSISAMISVGAARP